jgi:hypothetical protein
MTLLIPDGHGWADVDEVRRRQVEEARAAERAKAHAYAAAQLDYAGMSDRDLMQMQWSGSALRIWRDRGDDMRLYGEGAAAKIARSEAADAELSRRGIEERYC